MSYSLLADAGEALYGPHWQTSLAAGLGISSRTVRRWVAGAEPPGGVWADILLIAAERQSELAAIVVRLSHEKGWK